MEKIEVIDSISAYNKRRGIETLNPLVTVHEFAGEDPAKTERIHFGLYAIFYKGGNCGELFYGREHYGIFKKGH